jgi:hypothetical protein
MTSIKKAIITLFKNKGIELPTSEIILDVSKEYSKLKSQGKFNQARQIHRKVLYHLNMLVKESILRVEGYGKNGEKSYVLNVSAGEQLMEISPTKYKKELIGNKVLMPIIPMEGYEQKGIVLKYGSFTEQLNSLVILCNKFTGDLSSFIKKALIMVDDCICLENFATEVNKKNVVSFVKQLDKEFSTYGRKLSLSININDVEENQIIDLVRKTISLESVRFIFGINKSSLIRKESLISSLLEIYAREKQTIFIKNKDKFDLPYFVGNAGVYSFDEEEWHNMQEKPMCIACSQSTVILDVKKFYDSYGFNLIRFKELLMNISKSFLSVNPIQRKKIRDFFNEKMPNYHRDFLELSRNYVRLWNFGLLEPEIEIEKVLDIIHKTKEKIDEFARIQDRIFNSCGMPIRFKIALNQASRQSGESLSSARYKQMQVSGLNSIIEDLKDRIEETVKVSSYFDGGVHVKFNRVGTIMNSKELLNEVAVLLSRYNLAFFSYDFGGLEYGRN